MAPPGIVGRSKGLYPSQPLAGKNGRIRKWMGGLWNDMFPNGLIGPTPGGGSVTAATGVPHRAPNSLGEYFGGGSPSSQPAVGMASPLSAKRQMPLYGQSMLPGEQGAPGMQGVLGGQAPLRSFGGGISSLFGRPPQSPYRPGMGPGVSPVGQGEMASIGALESLIGSIRGDTGDLRDVRMRQGELGQGRFDQNWSEYAQQAPLMNQYQSPQFAQTNQGLGPGGVSPLSEDEGQYWRSRGAYPSQPGTDQMYGRFAGGPLTGAGLQGFAPSALNNDYDGQVRMQPGGYGSPLTGPLGKSRDPEFSDEAVAARQAQRMARIKADQDLPGGGSSRLREATARRDAWREANGMRSSSDIMGRRADRDAARAETLQNNQARNLSRRGISPLSAEGQSLAPDLYTAMQQRRRGGAAADGSMGSPLTLTQPDGTSTPVSPVPQAKQANTPAVQAQAKTAMQALQQRPVFSTLGLGDLEEPPTVYDVAYAVDSQIVQNGMDLGPEELTDLHQWAVQASKTATKDSDPFASNSFWVNSVSEANQQKWKALSEIPLADKRAVQKWWEDYKRPRLAPDAMFGG